MNVIHPEKPEPRPRPIDLVAPSIACAVAMGLASVAICCLSATVDEWRYVHDGVRRWFGGDAVWLIDSGTLPLPFWIQNAPGSLCLWIKHGGLPGGVASDFGKTLPLSDQVALLRSSRLMNLLLAGPGTIWAAWLVAFRRFGPRAAAATALLCAVEPNLLAGYALATGDAIIVPFALLAMLAYSAYLRRPSPANLLATAGIFGLGVALKISLLPLGLLLLGAVFLVELTGQLRGDSRPVSVVARVVLRFLLVDAPALVGLALLLAWAANGFLMGYLLDPAMPNEAPYKIAAALGYERTEAARLVGRLQVMRVPAPLVVLRAQAGHSRWGHPMTFLGRSGIHGPWFYYPYIFLMKSHLALLFAAAVGLLLPSTRRSPAAWGAALMVVLSCTMGIKGGPRYFLVLYALLAVLGGVGIAACLRRLTPLLAVGTVLALGAAVLALTLGSLPDLLTHTNPLWGGDAEGYRFADANYDWGQGLDEAATWADRRRLRPIVYLHTGDPFFGVPEGREVLTDQDPRKVLDRMRGHFAAVSVHWLFHSGAEASPLEPLIRSLRALGPDGRLCRTYFFFDLRSPSRHAELARLVACESGPSRIAPARTTHRGGLERR